METATANINAAGTAHVMIGGKKLNASATDVDDARANVLTAITSNAAELGVPVHVKIEDPTGEWSLLVSPDGTVTEHEEPSEAIDETPEKTIVIEAPAPAATPVEEPKELEVAEAPTEEQPALPAVEPALVTRRDLRGRAAESFSETKRPTPTGPAEMGWQGTVNKISNGALKIAPGLQETQIRESNRAIRRGLDGHKTVAFVNQKGGVGKSTDCYLMGATFGRTRGGSVLGWDSNPDKGTLGERAMSANHDHTAIDLLTEADFFANRTNSEEDLVNYVRPQGENHFDILASQNKSSTAIPIDGEGFSTLHATLRRFYRLILVDTGNASNTDTWQAAVEAADVLVICTLNKEDAAKTAAATIDTLEAQGHGDKVQNAVVIISQTQTPNGERMERMKSLFGQLVRTVVEVPFDKHLDQGEEIEWNNLAPATQLAFLHATAAVTNGL